MSNESILREALQVGLDCAREVADQYHISMFGYRPERHARLDADVKLIEAALAATAAPEQPSERDRFTNWAKANGYDVAQAHTGDVTRFLSPMTRDLYLAWLESSATTTRLAISDAAINEITMGSIGKWPSFEAQSWACKVVHAVLAAPVQQERDRDAERMKGLRELCGYAEDGSSIVVTIFQDDATRDWFVKVDNQRYFARSFKGAIDAAIAVTPKEQAE